MSSQFRTFCPGGSQSREESARAMGLLSSLLLLQEFILDSCRTNVPISWLTFREEGLPHPWPRDPPSSGRHMDPSHTWHLHLPFLQPTRENTSPKRLPSLVSPTQMISSFYSQLCLPNILEHRNQPHACSQPQ